jgi:chaperonin GroES
MAARAFKRFLPLLDRVLVERLEPELKTKSGIMLPDTKAGSKILEANVLATGPGPRNEKGEHMPMQVKVGDRVVLPEFGGQKLIMEDKEYFIFRDAEILGKFDQK